jgi:uncharacterized membrane-anchored protein YhcB (DUF1043 family)
LRALDRDAKAIKKLQEDVENKKLRLEEQKKEITFLANKMQGQYTSFLLLVK